MISNMFEIGQEEERKKIISQKISLYKSYKFNV